MLLARFTSSVQYFLFIFILDRICYSSSLVFWCICILVLLFSQPLKSLIHSCERLSCVSQTAARIPIIFIENQRQIHGEIHGHDHGVDDNREFWRRKTSGTFWHQSIAEKNTATPSWRCLSIAVFLFPDLLYCLLHNVTFSWKASRVLCSGKGFPNMLPKVSSYGQFDNCGEGPSDNSHKKYFCPSSLNISWLRCIKSICWRTGEVLKYLLQEYAQNVKLMESLPGPRGVFFLPLRLWN